MGLSQRLLALVSLGASAVAFAPRRLNIPSGQAARLQSAALKASVEDKDKVEVTEYFNNEGFDRWNRIYSASEDVNNVQLDIRTGHDQTIAKVLKWVDEDGDAAGQTFCDAGCGVGSLAIPLAQRGAEVSASDISDAMVSEASRRAEGVLPAEAFSKMNFKTADLESLSGAYDTVTCIDVMIHYPSERMQDMVSKVPPSLHRGSAGCSESNGLVVFSSWAAFPTTG
uniref:Methyltransferase domain-containing protein n=1 Tax=Pinguiococcus pyrenoidosus TaxID=172671 RepID=A0A7R9U5L8_9STRA